MKTVQTPMSLFPHTPYKTSGLFPRYPGGKGWTALSLLPNDILMKGLDISIEPYAGSGICTMTWNARDRFLAEADLGVYSLWSSFIRGETQDVERELRTIQALFKAKWEEYLDLIKDEMTAFLLSLDMDTSRSSWFLEPAPPEQRGNAMQFYKELKQKYAPKTMDLAWNHLKHLVTTNGYGSGCSPLCAAAALAIRKLTFQGYVRDGANKELNVKWTHGQVPTFLSYTPQWPYKGDGNYHLYNDAMNCVYRFIDGDFEGDAVAIIDPPYYSEEKMYPAYRGHDPNNIETLVLMLEPCIELMQDPRTKRIILCNYANQTSVAAVDELIKKFPAFSVTNEINRPIQDQVERLWILDRNK